MLMMDIVSMILNIGPDESGSNFVFNFYVTSNRTLLIFH